MANQETPKISTQSQKPGLVTQRPRREDGDINKNTFIIQLESWRAHKYEVETTSKDQRGFLTFSELLTRLEKGMDTSWDADKFYDYLIFLNYALDHDDEIKEFRFKLLNIRKNILQKSIDVILKEMPAKDTSLMEKISGFINPTPEKTSFKAQGLINFKEYIYKTIGQIIEKANSDEQKLNLEKRSANPERLEEINTELNAIKTDRPLYADYKTQLNELKF